MARYDQSKANPNTERRRERMAQQNKGVPHVKRDDAAGNEQSNARKLGHPHDSEGKPEE